MDSRTYIIMNRIQSIYPKAIISNFKRKSRSSWTDFTGARKWNTSITVRFRNLRQSGIHDNEDTFYYKVLLTGVLPKFVYTSEVVRYDRSINDPLSLF